MKIVRFKKDQSVMLGLLTPSESYVLPFEKIVSNWTQDNLVQWLNIAAESDAVNRLKAAYETIEDQAETENLISAESIRLLSPIGRPIHDIICLGVNYHDHREEARDAIVKFEEPPKTVYFGKRASQIIGPGAAIEGCFDVDSFLDYEVELAVIIGKRGHDISVEEAEDYIFGYSVFNDLSSRQLQKDHVQWYRGKGLDTYSAMGPCVLHRSALPFPIDLEITSMVNGDVRQKSRTAFMITGIAEAIADLSRGMTLEPGDIIATGTPSGVGMGFKPERYMRAGDLVTCCIEKIGTLTNPVKRRE